MYSAPFFRKHLAPTSHIHMSLNGECAHAIHFKQFNTANNRLIVHSVQKDHLQFLLILHLKKQFCSYFWLYSKKLKCFKYARAKIQSSVSFVQNPLKTSYFIKNTLTEIIAYFFGGTDGHTNTQIRTLPFLINCHHWQFLPPWRNGK